MGLFRMKGKQEYKVMRQAERAGGAVLPEYHRATPECPHPERWHMYDSMTAEIEVLELLRRQRLGEMQLVHSTAG